MKCPKCETDNPSDSKFCRECATPLPIPGAGEILPTETLEIVPEPSISGTIFAGRYKVIEELGRGGMGRVYRAYDNHLREEVALKIIKPEVASDKKALERFSNELKLARKIIHRNVCRMYELMEYQGVRFISMEYVPGEDLKSFIRRARRLDIGAAVAIAAQLCEGLAEAHRLGVVHRDLKPSNIMIDKEGNAKIMDFGIARSLLEKGITGEGGVVGTPEYISPEQIEGKAADPQSDLYALGVILFEMVCGKYPFEGDTARIIAQKIQGKKPPDPKTINPHVPDNLAKVILKCLEKRTDKRYGNAAEVVAELQKIENDLPTSERITIKTRSSIFAGLTRKIQKRKILGTAIGLVAVALVVILVSRPWRSSPRAAVAPQKPTLAVLLFGNNTNDPGLDNWKTFLCSLFITAIRQQSSPRIAVLSIDSIYSYLTKLGLDKANLYSSDDLRKIASSGNATHIMTGYLLKHGQNLRLAYDLKDAAAAQLLGSGYQDGSGTGDFGQMVDDLAKNVLRDLGTPSRGITKTIKTDSTLALQSYLGARDLEIRANLSENPGEKEAMFAQMLQKLQMAIEAAPKFAAAYWGLGDYYEHRFVGSHKPEDFDLMKKNYELAYQLDPESAGANAGLGWARYYEERLDDAYRYFVRAFELEPETPAINVNVGSFLCSIGLIEKGISYFTRAIESGDKTTSAYRRRAHRYMDIGQWSAAADDAKKTMEMEPNNNYHHRFYVRILAMMKRFDEAERELAIAEKLDPGNSEIPFVRAYIYSAQGDKKNALPILDKAKTGNLFWYIYFLSQNYTRLGLNDEAIEIIREGIEKGFAEAHEYLYPYPVLNSRSYENLRADPRFQEILKSQKEKYDHQFEKYRGL